MTGLFHRQNYKWVRQLNILAFLKKINLFISLVETISFFKSIKYLVLYYFKSDYQIKLILKKKLIFFLRPTTDIGVLTQFFNKCYKLYPKNQTEKNQLNILDLGAHIGSQTIRFLNDLPLSKIIAVEPEPKNFEILKKNTINFPQIKLENVGISNVSNEVWIQKNDKGSSSENFETMSEINKIDKNEYYNKIEIKDIKYFMDKYNLDKFDVIKIDINSEVKNLFKSENFLNLLNKSQIIITRITLDDLNNGLTFFMLSKIFNLDIFNIKICDDNLNFIKKNSFIDCKILDSYLF